MSQASTPAAKTYNAFVSGENLLSVLVLLKPDPLGNSALRPTSFLPIDLVQKVSLAVFAVDFVLHWPWWSSLTVTRSALPDRRRFCDVVLLRAAGSQSATAVNVQVRPHPVGVQAAQVHR